MDWNVLYAKSYPENCEFIKFKENWKTKVISNTQVRVNFPKKIVNQRPLTDTRHLRDILKDKDEIPLTIYSQRFREINVFDTKFEVLAKPI